MKVVNLSEMEYAGNPRNSLYLEGIKIELEITAPAIKVAGPATLIAPEAERVEYGSRVEQFDNLLSPLNPGSTTVIPKGVTVVVVAMAEAVVTGSPDFCLAPRTALQPL